MKYLAIIIFSLYIINSASAAVVNCSCVAFRLDDIQDYYLNTVQQSIMQLFRDKRAPLTVGVIANYFGGDSSIVAYLNDGMIDPNWSMEIAQHGWSHEDFTNFTYDEQLSLLTQSVSKIETYVPGVKIQSFIPPFNAFNNNTVAALKALNFTTMTSQLELDRAPYFLSGQTFYRFPEGAQTSVEDPLLGYVGVPANTTMKQVRSQLISYGFSVVMMHPMEFAQSANGAFLEPAAVNDTQFKELSDLVDMIINSGLKIVLLKDIPANVPVSTTGIPATTGPATTGPVTTGQATTGPVTTGQATTGSATTGTPATTGSTTGTIRSTTGSATTGSATTGSVSTTGATRATTGSATTGSVSTTGARITTTGTAQTTTGSSTTGTIRITTGSTTGVNIGTTGALSGGGNPDSLNTVSSSTVVLPSLFFLLAAIFALF